MRCYLDESMCQSLERRGASYSRGWLREKYLSVRLPSDDSLTEPQEIAIINQPQLQSSTEQSSKVNVVR